MKYIFIASLIAALSLSALLTSPVSAVEPSGASAPVQTAINTVLPTLEQLEQGQLSEEMSEEQQKELWDLAHEQLGGAADLAIALADQNPSLSALQDILVVQALAEQMGFSDLSSRLLKAARKTLDKLATDAITECKARPGPAAHRALIKIMELAQLLGFDDINARVQEIEPKCKVPYKIEQTDRVPYTFNMPGILQSSGASTETYFGQPSAPADKGSQGWKTSWSVIQDSSGFNDTTLQINLPGVTSTPVSGQASTTDRTRLDFSLVGVKSGGTFPITVTRIGTYTQNNYVPPQAVLFTVGDQQYLQTVGESGTLTSGAIQLKIEGILQEDLGDQGAVIAFGKPPFTFPGLVMSTPPPLRIVSAAEESDGSGDGPPALPSVPESYPSPDVPELAKAKIDADNLFARGWLNLTKIFITARNFMAAPRRHSMCSLIPWPRVRAVICERD